MPFKSKAQMKYMFANMPAMAREWAAKTKDAKNLPAKARDYSSDVVKKALSKFKK